MTADGSLLICVRERHEDDDVVNELVAIPTDGSSDASIVVDGRDFFSTPRISPDGTKLAWLTWNLPYLPWDGSELWVADLDAAGVVSGRRLVAGQARGGVDLPTGVESGRRPALRLGPHRLVEPLSRGRRRACSAICPMDAEFGWPQWVFGLSTYAFLDDGRIACIWTRNGTQHVAVIDPRTGELLDLDLPYDAIDFPCIAAEGQSIAFIGASARYPPQVVLLDFLARVDRRAEGERRRSRSTPSILSAPRAIEFPTEGGLTAHAFFYPPANKDFTGPSDERPPLIVMSHGGPTSAVCAEFDMATALLDEPWLRASSTSTTAGAPGYGRAYRERLNGNWGVVDTDGLHQRRPVPGGSRRGRRRPAADPRRQRRAATPRSAR